MQFPGAWISKTDDGVAVVRDIFDETELSEHSNWTQAHQNEDPSLAAGHIDPAMILAEAGRRLLQARPDWQSMLTSMASPPPAGIGAPDGEGLRISSLEAYGLFCLSLCDAISVTVQARSKGAAGTPAGTGN